MHASTEINNSSELHNMQEGTEWASAVLHTWKSNKAITLIKESKVTLQQETN